MSELRVDATVSGYEFAVKRLQAVITVCGIMLPMLAMLLVELDDLESKCFVTISETLVVIAILVALYSLFTSVNLQSALDPKNDVFCREEDISALIKRRSIITMT